MVTNTTIYTRQMYVSLSSDTPDVDFHNGDEVYLIDTRQRVIYDEENSTWYPIPTGGGGGGDPYELARKIANGSITEYVDDEITELKQNAFYRCTHLTVFRCHHLTTVGLGALSSTGITAIALPAVTSLGINAMQSASLEAADLGSSLGTIPQGTFQNAALTVLILRRTSMTALGNISAFNSTPFASGGSGGTLYVPSALIASYQSATNWSTILGYTNNQIKAIEGSIYETQYADGTPIS